MNIMIIFFLGLIGWHKSSTEFIKCQNELCTRSQVLILKEDHSAIFSNTSDNNFLMYRKKLNGYWSERSDSLFLTNYDGIKKIYLKKNAYEIKFLVSVEDIDDWVKILESLKHLLETDETFIELDKDSSIEIDRRKIIVRRLIVDLFPKAYEGTMRDIYIQRREE